MAPLYRISDFRGRFKKSGTNRADSGTPAIGGTAGLRPAGKLKHAPPNAGRLRSVPDDFDAYRGLHLVLALRVRTVPYGARLQPLLHHVGAAALRTLLRHGLAPGDEGAVGVAVAAVEGLALLGEIGRAHV